MQTKTKTTGYNGRERNKALIGVLTAISVVSRRLASRLSDLEQRYEKGEKSYDTRPSATIRQ